MKSKSVTLCVICMALAISFSCKHNHDSTSTDLIEFNIDSLLESGEQVNFSDLFSGFEIIPLEAKEGSYLSRIDNLFFINDTFFISDRFETKSIYLFSREGEFINKINRTGRGPGEYSNLADFIVVPKSRSIQIFDWNGSKLIFYSFEGDYSRDITIGHRFSSFIFSEDSYYFFRPFPDHPDENSDEYLIYEYDIQGNELSQQYQYSKVTQGPRIIHFTFGGNFHKSPNGIRFYRKYCDTIYTLGAGLQPYIYLNTTKYKLSKEEIEEMRDHFDPTAMHELKKLDGITHYSENSNMAFIAFNIGLMPYYAFYYFDTGKILCPKPVDLRDDLTQIRPNLLTISDEYMIARMHPTQIPRFKEKINEGKVELSEEERNKLLGLSDFSNPIIVLFKLKE